MAAGLKEFFCIMWVTMRKCWNEEKKNMWERWHNPIESLWVLYCYWVSCVQKMKRMGNLADLYVLIFKFSGPYFGTKRFLNWMVGNIQFTVHSVMNVILITIILNTISELHHIFQILSLSYDFVLNYRDRMCMWTSNCRRTSLLGNYWIVVYRWQLHKNHIFCTWKYLTVWHYSNRKVLFARL
jgi:hypothetical protein